MKKKYTTIFTFEEKLYSHVKKNERLVPGVSLNHLQPPWLTLSLEISASLMASNAAILVQAFHQTVGMRYKLDEQILRAIFKLNTDYKHLNNESIRL